MKIEGETFLTAKDAAAHLGVSRPTFYKRYKQVLDRCKIGELERRRYRLSDLDALRNRVVVDSVAS